MTTAGGVWCQTCAAERADRIQSHASDTMSSSAGLSGIQPSSDRMRSLDATSTGGSPARRGDSTAGIWQPVTNRAASTTSRTENPVPLPRLKMRQVVGHGDLVAAVDQVPGDDASDVAGASDDECSQEDFPVRSASPTVALLGRVGKNGHDGLLDAPHVTAPQRAATYPPSNVGKRLR